MSAALLGMAFAADMGTRSRKLVLLKLVDCCRDDGSKIFPGVASIAAAAQCAPRQVQRELAAMVEIGLLRIVKEGGRGRGSTTEYALDVQTLQTISLRGWEASAARIAAVAEAAPEAGDGDDSGDVGDDETAAPEASEPATIKGDMASPLSRKGDITDTFRVTSPTAKGDASVTQPLNREPLEEPSEGERERAGAQIRSDREGDPAPAAVPDADLLDDLRKRHPASAHDDQWAVEAAWANLSPEERAEAVAHFDAWLGGRKGRERILGLPKYLAQRSWRYLPPKAPDTAKAAAAAAGKVLVPVFSRLMWWIVFEALRRGDVRRARYVLESAKAGTAGVLRDDERLPSGDEERAMAQLDRGSDGFRAWRQRVFAEHRIDLPIPAVAPFVFMPAPWPPRTGMGAVLEDDEEVRFGGVG